MGCLSTVEWFQKDILLGYTQVGFQVGHMTSQVGYQVGHMTSLVGYQVGHMTSLVGYQVGHVTMQPGGLPCVVLGKIVNG